MDWSEVCNCGISQSHSHPFYKQFSTYLFAGAMAGMGVALLVVSFVLAVVGMYFYYKKQGGAFLPKKFDNTDITKDVS